MHGLDDHLLLHAEVQRLHRAAGAEQGLVGARLLQPWHQMGPGGGQQVYQAEPVTPLPCPGPSPPEACPDPLVGGNHSPINPTVLSLLRQTWGRGTSVLESQGPIIGSSAHCQTLGNWFSL